jgi:hypothetical protein
VRSPLKRIKYWVRDWLGLGAIKYRGDIILENVKVKVSLPESWGYYDLGDLHYLVGADKEIGTLIFSAQHLIMVEVGDFINFYTNEKEEIQREQQGRFDTYTVQGAGERQWTRIWETDTNTHFLRFIYVCPKTKNHIEMETVLSIVHSLEELP